MPTPAYPAFDPAKPDPTTQNITQFGQSTRDNMNALRDAAIMGSGFPGFNLSTAGGVGTGSITGNVLTITAMTSGAFGVGETLSGAGISGNPPISALGTGAGGLGTYNVTHANVGSIAVTGVNPTPTQPNVMTWTKGTERVRCALTWGTAGGELGNVTVAVYSYSNDSGATYSPIATKTIAYDGNGNVTTTTWS